MPAPAAPATAPPQPPLRHMSALHQGYQHRNTLQLQHASAISAESEQIAKGSWSPPLNIRSGQPCSGVLRHPTDQRNALQLQVRLQCPKPAVPDVHCKHLIYSGLIYLKYLVIQTYTQPRGHYCSPRVLVLNIVASQKESFQTSPVPRLTFDAFCVPFPALS